MNAKKLIASLALVASLTTAAAAQAEGKIYVGAKLGAADSGIAGFDNTLIAGVYGGYNLLGKDAQFAANLGGGTLAAEGAVDTTTVRGKTVWGSKWDVTSAAIYAAYRFPLSNSFYLKGKAGLVHYDIGTTNPGALPNWALVQTGTTDTIALGIGGGFKVGPGAIEIELTTFSGDLLTATAGFHLSF